MEYLVRFYVTGDRQRFNTVVDADDAEAAISAVKAAQGSRDVTIYSTAPRSDERRR